MQDSEMFREREKRERWDLLEKGLCESFWGEELLS